MMNASRLNHHNDDDDDMDDRIVREASFSSTAPSTLLSMEMESLHPGSMGAVRRTPRSATTSCLSQLWMLIKLHCESYPKLLSTIFLILLAVLMYFAVEYSKPTMARHAVNRDYSKIGMDYNFKASQIDHWCLFGGDTACQCEDFTEPISREEIPGWVAAHQANKNRVKADFDYDVVFLGDDVVEEMNGSWLNLTRPDGVAIQQNFIETFSKEKGGELDGLALGIAGDSSSNLLWRIQHGEMPSTLFSKVWWISVGTNDLARGGCSEEATVLGILRVAEEVYFNNEGSVVVIQGILPRSTSGDGSLMSKGNAKVPFFVKKRSEQYYADRARNNLQLWPSIQNVNKELQDFCKEHGHIVYFDASNLFLGGIANPFFQSKNLQIMSELMPDYVHLGFEGHKVLNAAIKTEIQRIVLDEDETNDIEQKGNNGT